MNMVYLSIYLGFLKFLLFLACGPILHFEWHWKTCRSGIINAVFSFLSQRNSVDHKDFLVQAPTRPDVSQGRLSMVSQKECTEHTFQEQSANSSESPVCILWVFLLDHSHSSDEGLLSLWDLHVVNVKNHPLLISVSLNIISSFSCD